MIKAALTNEILDKILAIEKNRFSMASVELPALTKNRLRKNSKKKSSYASNKIEGNPLTEQQADAAIEGDPHRHFLKPEQEIRNYFMAINFLEEKLSSKEPFSLQLLLDVQAIVEKGAPKEMTGLRGPMPPGYLFAVYDAQSRNADYIPPDHTDLVPLLNELTEYVNSTDDHPLIIAAIVHYQLAAIHPFEDGNGRTARLMSGYILDYYGYGFNGIGSLEEYFSYDVDEYYNSLQMGLPPLYYSGRDNPPHPEIWITYFLRMVELYSTRVCEISKASAAESITRSISFLSPKERALLTVLLKRPQLTFTPIEISKIIGVTNKTVITRCAGLAANGLIKPNLTGERIRSYTLSEFAQTNRQQILNRLENGINMK